MEELEVKLEKLELGTLVGLRSREIVPVSMIYYVMIFFYQNFPKRDLILVFYGFERKIILLNAEKSIVCGNFCEKIKGVG